MLKKEEKILDPSSRLYNQINYFRRFRVRTFKLPTADFDLVENEEVKLKLQESCGSCKSQLIAPQLKKAVENTFEAQNQVYALCTFCGKRILEPLLHITIGKKSTLN